MKKMNKTVLFLILVFSISFSLALIFKLLGGDISNQLAYTLMGATYMFIPAICVLIVEKLIHKQPLQKNLLISFKINKWFVIAWLSMPILAFITIGVSLLFPDVIFTPDMAGLFKRYEAMLNPETTSGNESIDRNDAYTSYFPYFITSTICRNNH
jgi:hypothetical protein